MTPTGLRRSLASRISFLMSPSLTVALSLLSTRMHGSSGAPLGSRIRQDEVAVLRELLADGDARPRPRLFCEVSSPPAFHAGDLRHFGFEFVVPFAKLSDFSQTIFDPAGEVVPVGLSRAQFILVALSDLCGSFRQFGFESRPSVLVVVIVLLLKQAEGFFSAELCYTSEVLDPKAIQNLGSLQLPRAQTERAFDGVIHRGQLRDLQTS